MKKYLLILLASASVASADLSGLTQQQRTSLQRAVESLNSSGLNDQQRIREKKKLLAYYQELSARNKQGDLSGLTQKQRTSLQRAFDSLNSSGLNDQQRIREKKRILAYYQELSARNKQGDLSGLTQKQRTNLQRAFDRLNSSGLNDQQRIREKKRILAYYQELSARNKRGSNN